jgi:hypothetical protein
MEWSLEHVRARKQFRGRLACIGTALYFISLGQVPMGCLAEGRVTLHTGQENGGRVVWKPEALKYGVDERIVLGDGRSGPGWRSSGRKARATLAPGRHTPRACR